MRHFRRSKQPNEGNLTLCKPFQRDTLQTLSKYPGESFQKKVCIARSVHFVYIECEKRHRILDSSINSETS